MALALPSPLTPWKKIVKQIITHGPNARPSLGVSVLPDHVRRQYSRYLQRELEGAIIAKVVPDGPAEALGLEACGPGELPGGIKLGDMITGVNDLPVKRNEDLLCVIEEAEPDVPLRLKVMRGCDPEQVEELIITPVRRQALMSSWGEMEQGDAKRVPTPTPKGMWWGRPR